MKAYENKVKQGFDAHEDFKHSRVVHMRDMTAKSVETLQKVREREANANNDVLVQTVSKLKKAEKNKDKALKEWQRDREEQNDRIL